MDQLLSGTTRWLYESPRTVAEDDEPQETQVPLSLYGVPAEVGVTLGEQDSTALKTTTCQVHHHLHTDTQVMLVTHKPVHAAHFC